MWYLFEPSVLILLHNSVWKCVEQTLVCVWHCKFNRMSSFARIRAIILLKQRNPSTFLQASSANKWKHQSDTIFHNWGDIFFYSICPLLHLDKSSPLKGCTWIVHSIKIHLANNALVAFLLPKQLWPGRTRAWELWRCPVITGTRRLATERFGSCGWCVVV